MNILKLTTTPEGDTWRLVQLSDSNFEIHALDGNNSLQKRSFATLDDALAVFNAMTQAQED